MSSRLYEFYVGALREGDLNRALLLLTAAGNEWIKMAWQDETSASESTVKTICSLKREYGIMTMLYYRVVFAGSGLPLEIVDEIANFTGPFSDGYGLSKISFDRAVDITQWFDEESEDARLFPFIKDMSFEQGVSLLDPHWVIGFGTLDPKIRGALTRRIAYLESLENYHDFAHEARQLAEALEQSPVASTPDTFDLRGKGAIPSTPKPREIPRGDPVDETEYLRRSVMAYFPLEYINDRLMVYLEYHSECLFQSIPGMSFHMGVYDLWLIITTLEFIKKPVEWFGRAIYYPDYEVEGDALSH